jgi:hypothetical protein
MSDRASDRHPLDTDLLDLVEGALDAAAAQFVEEHLAGCVLCRIKRQRLAAAPPIDFTDLRDVQVPSFGAIETVDAPLEDVRAGDLWLTAGDESTMILIRKVLDPDLGLVVVPVTFDVEVADSGTLVLEASASPLAVPIAIYDGMLSSLPTRALQSRVEPVRAVDLLHLVVGNPGVTRGSELVGSGDVRHEVRQYIADRLTQLAPVDDDAENTGNPDGATDPPPASADVDYPTFRRELDDLRAEGLTVEPCPELTGCPAEWIALGEIHRRYQTLAIIGTPAGLTSDSDFVAARSLVLRWHLSALVICPREGTTVDLYSPEALYDGFALPSGAPSRQPFVDTHGLRDSVLKFLGTRDPWNVPSRSETGRIERVNVTELLQELAQKAASELGVANVRGEKRQGWRAAAARGSRLAEVLQEALGGAFDPARIAELADEDPT